MRCVECGAEGAGAARVCARCGAPVAGPGSVAALAAGAVSSGPGQAASAAVATATGQTTQEPYVPGRGHEAPPGLRRVLQGYSWMGCGALLCAWVLVMAGAYFSNLDSSPSNSAHLCLWASIAPVVLAAILFGHHIRWSLFLRRPRDGCSATVRACQRGGHALTLDAPCDGYPSGLRVRLAWWAEPAGMLPGESVMFYGRPDGTGRVLVSSSARHRAIVGTGRRRPGPPGAEETVQDAVHQPAGQRAWRRYLQWGPQVIAGLGLVGAVVATLLAWVPPLTGHVGTGQLRPGDCLTGSLGLGSGNWPYMMTTAPCTDPHLGEVFYAGNAWPKSQTTYPGDNKISDQGLARCLTAFTAYDGLDNSSSELSIYYILPYDWSNGDRWLVCIAYEPTDQYPGGMPVNQSIKGSNQ